MQKSKDLIELAFENLEAKTKQISDVLSDVNGLQNPQIEVLMKLYDERKESLEQISFWYNSDNKALSEEMKSSLRNKMDKLLKNDADNLLVIKNKLDELGTKLRNLNKNKSLLIYIK